jgi:hypothetical protein
MKRTALIISIALALLAVSIAAAQTGAGYDLTWSTIDSGGYTFSTGGAYSLGGTIGQPEAAVMSGSAYTVSGGFWFGSTAHMNIYLPLIVK